MFSFEDLAAIRVAAELCNDSELKKEMLCHPRFDHNGIDRFKEQWNNIVKNTAEILLEKLGLIKELKEKVRALVLLIGMKMLKWAVYHERPPVLSRDFSIKFLNSSLFTSQGIIDNKKAAEKLMKDESLSITQKYKFACICCLTEHIPDLYTQLRQLGLFDDQSSSWFVRPQIVKFWSYYQMGRIDEFRGEMTLDEYMLEKAVLSGSKAAVEFCLENTDVKRNGDAVIDAALKAVRNKKHMSSVSGFNQFQYEEDYIVFANEKHFYSQEWWIPSDYFVDILYSLFSKMREDQKIDFLKRDIERARFEIIVAFDENPKHSRVLEYFLDWPYQKCFMKTAKLTWEFLPERSYADLLLKICEKINPRKSTLIYGEENTYDYRKLLREFWCESPDHYKRYVFSDKEITNHNGEQETLKEGKELLIKLFKLKNFTYEDSKNIEVILDSASNEEKERIISSKEGKHVCTLLMRVERWALLDGFVSNCLPSKEQAEEFKRLVSFTKDAQNACISFIRDDKWDAVEFFMKWSALPEDKIIRLKREMTSAWYGRMTSAHLYLYKGVEFADKFCEWLFSSEEEIGKYKRELILSDMVESSDIEILIERDTLNVVDEFGSWSLSSPEKIAEFKKHLCNEKGNYICKNLIMGGLQMRIFNQYDFFEKTTEFQGGKWDQVEMLLTWCFSSEEEIREFKKNKCLKESGKKIHFHLIESNQWEEAETFFAWLGLSPEEVKQLKKETLFNYTEANTMFRTLMSIREDDERFESFGFSDYGSRQEAIELFLRWYLTDEETVLEFRDHFKKKYENKEISEEDRAVLEDFNLAIGQRLRDLDEEQRGTKRKSEISEDLCHVERKESRWTEYER